MEKIYVQLDEKTIPADGRYIGFEIISEDGETNYYGKYNAEGELVQVSQDVSYDMWQHVVSWWYVLDEELIASIDASVGDRKHKSTVATFILKDHPVQMEKIIKLVTNQ